MRFALLVALSHLRSRRHDVGVSAITFISMIGVMVGVTALIMVLAGMEGFEIDLRDKILGSNAHIVVLQYGAGIPDYAAEVAKVEASEGVAATSMTASPVANERMRMPNLPHCCRLSRQPPDDRLC